MDRGRHVAPALLMWATVEQVVCVPTWAVLTSGCGAGSEVGGVSTLFAVREGP